MADDPVRLDPDKRFDRLYTPWRMGYVRGDRKSNACVFCAMRDSNEDVENLVLERGHHCYIVMNLFPYNTGHLLIVPNEHVASPEELAPDSRHEMADLVARALEITRFAISPDAFNIGINLGSDAGAGIASHLHEHIVPRWRGDANFMPIVGGVRVLPEELPATYAKLKAEFQRNTRTATPLVVRNADNSLVLVDQDADGDPTLATVAPIPGEPVWRTALDQLADKGVGSQITGWSGKLDAIEIQTDVPLHECESGNWKPLNELIRS